MLTGKAGCGDVGTSTVFTTLPQIYIKFKIKSGPEVGGSEMRAWWLQCRDVPQGYRMTQQAPETASVSLGDWGGRLLGRSFVLFHFLMKFQRHVNITESLEEIEVMLMTDHVRKKKGNGNLQGKGICAKRKLLSWFTTCLCSKLFTWLYKSSTIY